MDRGRWISGGAQALLSVVFLLWALGARRAAAGPAGGAAAAVLCVPALLFAWGSLRVFTGRAAARGFGGKAAAVFCALFGFMLAMRFALAVFAPQIGEAGAASAEAEVRGALASFRAAIGDAPPARPSMLVPGKMAALPRLRLPRSGHPGTREVFFGPPAAARDRGTWLYDNDANSPTFGTVIVDCTHTDSRGTAWNSY